MNQPKTLMFAVNTLYISIDSLHFFWMTQPTYGHDLSITIVCTHSTPTMCVSPKNEQFLLLMNRTVGRELIKWLKCESYLQYTITESENNGSFVVTILPIKLLQFFCIEHKLLHLYSDYDNLSSDEFKSTEIHTQV